MLQNDKNTNVRFYNTNKVQLPMHHNKADADFKHWCLIREAQMNTFQTIKNTGIAVAIDYFFSDVLGMSMQMDVMQQRARFQLFIFCTE